jgi:hypothetical protein
MITPATTANTTDDALIQEENSKKNLLHFVIE